MDEMERVEAIQWLMRLHPSAAFVLSNGLTSREAVAFLFHQRCFYMVHGMGEALSVGIGLKSALPNTDIVVVEGDGGAVMGAASWCLLPIDRLHYYVLVNGVYETTGGQPVPLPSWEPDDVYTVNIQRGKRKSPIPPDPDTLKLNFKCWLRDNA